MIINITAALLLIAKNRKNWVFQLHEWYDEIWNITINDKQHLKLSFKKQL